MGGGKYRKEGKSHKEIKPCNEETLRQGKGRKYSKEKIISRKKKFSMQENPCTEEKFTRKKSLTRKEISQEGKPRRRIIIIKKNF